MSEKGELINKIKEKYSKNELAKHCKELGIKMPEKAGKNELLNKLKKLSKNDLDSILSGKKKEKKTQEKVIEISLKPNKWMIPAIGFIALIIILILINQPATNINDNNTITGKALLTFIVDASCSECYDVTINEEILTQQYGVELTTKTVDVNSNEGASLINQYQITKIPTFILKGDAVNSNTNLINVWDSVGTIAIDGALVFRSPEVISTSYKELVNGEFVMYVPPEVTIGSFMIMNESVCTESGKPIIYYFASDSCPHCSWEKPIIQNVTSSFGNVISYHENIDTQDDIDVFQKYLTFNQGGVPFIVIGCQYIRVGSGESAVTDEKTISELNLTNPDLIKNSMDLYNEASDYQMQAILAYNNNDTSYVALLENYTNLLKEASSDIERLVLTKLICNVTNNEPSSVCLN